MHNEAKVLMKSHLNFLGTIHILCQQKGWWEWTNADVC